MTTFASAEGRWVEGLGNLLNVIRQTVIAAQLADHVEAGMTVLDVGCGQGTQALNLARSGCVVAGIDPSEELLERCAVDAATTGVELRLIHGGIERLDALLSESSYDLVCCHGLLMYLPERAAAIEALARRIAPGGRLSMTFRNAHALAMRPALRGDWAAAVEAFDSRAYVNELGVQARADRLEEVETDLAGLGLGIEAWYGDRVFNDAVARDVRPPEGEELLLLLEAERKASARDPYRWMASQLHVIARRPRGKVRRSSGVSTRADAR